jgi:hypothetical protein
MIGHVGIFKDPDEIRVKFCFREQAGGGGAMGDSTRVVVPGGSLYGWSYEALKAHGEGTLDFELPKRRVLPARFREINAPPGTAFIIPGFPKP